MTHPDRQGSADSRRRRIGPRRKALFALVALAMAMALFEGAAALALALRSSKEAPPYYRYDARVGWEMRPGWSGSAFGYETYREIDADGYFHVDREQLRDDRAPRILVLADSTGYGFGVRHEDAWPETLDRLLPGASVICLAAPGHSSFQGLQTLRKRIERVRPDMVIASFNFNDRRYVIDPAYRDSEAYFRKLAAGERRRELLGHSNLLRLLLLAGDRARATGARKSAPSGDVDLLEDFATGAPMDVEQLTERVPPEDYARNLREIARLAREHDAQTLFLMLGDNPSQTATLREGARQFEAGELPTAVATLERALVIARQDATPGQVWFETVTRRLLAEALARQGRADEARAAGRIERPVANIVGHHPLQLDSVYRGMMRETALNEGAWLLDGAAALAGHPEYYFDHVHFLTQGHALLAAALADEIAARHPEWVALPWHSTPAREPRP